MGLFSKKKKPSPVQPLDELPPLPEFPEMPEESNSPPAFPDDHFGDIKEEVSKPVSSPEMKDELDFHEHSSVPSSSFTPPQSSFQGHSDDGPLFVKLEHYKDILGDVSSLKGKIAEADRLLSDLESLQGKEARLLNEWKEDISEVKKKLLDLDEHLAD